jgi:penicillin-binding protein 1A
MLRFLFKFSLFLLVLGTVSLAVVSMIIIPRLPDIETLKDVRMQVPLRIYTHDGSLIAEYGEKRRLPVQIEHTPKKLIDAFISAEDDRFYEHPGVDWQGIVRAAWVLVTTGQKKEGGSTITMQVARNFFLTREKSYVRKLTEIFLALKIERELSKNEILQLYLNKIYLGQRAYGVGSAAQVYYGKDVKDLTLAQMAMIAGLPKAPSATNPVSSPERALKRRAYVLNRMLTLGYINQAEFEKANQAPVTASLHSPSVRIEAPYVAEMVRKEMVKRYGDDAYSAGYNVYTTIRDRDQVAANHALRAALMEYDRRHGFRGPEQHVDLSTLDGEKGWKQLLETYPTIGNLYPALVTDVRDKSVTAYLSGIGPVDIGWDGLSWARRYITENRRGPKPKSAGDILKPGDIVRVVENDKGGWVLSQLPEVEGALVSMDPENGATLALVGGFDFYRSKFNRVTQAKRQPGSSFKPFVYSAALKAGYTAASVINDAPVVFNDPGIEDMWRPENYSGRYFGPTRLRVALYESRNLVSIRLLHGMGIDFALKQIKKFGYDIDKLPHNLSLALGSGAVSPWQHAAAYCILANGGYRVQPYYIERIENVQHKVVYEADPLVVCRDCEQNQAAGGKGKDGEGAAAQADTKQPAAAPTAETQEAADDAGAGAAGQQAGDQKTAGQQAADQQGGEQQNAEQQPAEPRIAPRVINAENDWIINSMTRDVIKRGTGRRARVLHRDDLSGKTGTTNDQRDAWFAGYNPDIVTVSWVGFDNFQPLGNYETGARAALPMWIKYMRVALKNIPETILERPPGLITARIDPQTGLLASPDNPHAIFEVFRPKYAPKVMEQEKGAGEYTKQQNTPENTQQLF